MPFDDKNKFDKDFAVQFKISFRPMRSDINPISTKKMAKVKEKFPFLLQKV